MSKISLLRQYTLRFILMLLGLFVSCPLIYIVTYNAGISFILFMTAFILSICLMIIEDIWQKNQTAIIRLLFRFILVLIICFGLFYYISVWARAFLSVFMLVLLSLLSYALNDRYQNIGNFSIVMFIVTFFLGFVDHRSVLLVSYGSLLSVFIIVSTISMLALFIVLNVDTARWFGMDGLSIPGTMKRSSLIIIVIVSVAITAMSFSSIIIETLSAVITGFFRLIYYLLSLLPLGLLAEGVPQHPSDIPFVSGSQPSEPSIIMMIISWIAIIAFLILFAGLIVFSIVKLVKYLIKLCMSEQNKATIRSEVFTEIIEKIEPLRKKRAPRSYIRQPRYSTLLTDRERIIFIYREYIKRAKRNGLTGDSLSDTPSEIIEEIAANISENNFPPPEGLDKAFNTANYSNNDLININTEELKKRLL